MEAQKEADRISGKKYALVRTPSREADIDEDEDAKPVDRALEKKKKKKKTRDAR